MPDEVVCQIEYFHDIHPGRPVAWAAFRRRVERLSQEDLLQWETTAVDSLTGARLAAEAEQEFVINPIPPGLKGPQVGEAIERHQLRWRAGATNQLERYLVGAGLARSPKNVVLTAHVENERVDLKGKKLGVVEYHNTIIRRIAVPGRLSSRNELPSQYSEVYRAYASVKAGKGIEKYRLQTELRGDEWIAKSQIGAPDGCRISYKALWDNWDLGGRPPLHIIIYGHPGSLKTQFITTMPKPLLVLFFDAPGCDTWFMRRFRKLRQIRCETEEGMTCLKFVRG